MNPKAETVEELLSRRKHLHLGMLKLAREDLALGLQAGIEACKVPNTHRVSSRRLGDSSQSNSTAAA